MDDFVLAVTFNEEGARRLYLFDTKTGQKRMLPAIPDGSVFDVSFHPTGTKLTWTLVQLDGTTSVHRYDLGSDSVREWTKPAPARDAHSSKARLIHYPTFDQVEGKPRTIPAWFWHPICRRKAHASSDQYSRWSRGSIRTDQRSLSPARPPGHLGVAAQRSRLHWVRKNVSHT